MQCKMMQVIPYIRVTAAIAHPVPMVPPLTNPKALLSAGVPFYPSGVPFFFNAVRYINLIVVIIR